MRHPEKTTSPGSLDRQRLKSIYESLRPAYEAALQAVLREIRACLERHGHSPNIKYRVKRFENYFEKLGRFDQGGKPQALSDLLGLRIICPFLEDLETVEGLLVKNFEVVELERKGARHSFREFGYDSVHLLIRLDRELLGETLPHSAAVAEVQLRTILQDAWAEVEHELIYKSDISLPNESVKRKLASLNATLTLSDLIFQEIRDYQREIRDRDRKRRQSLEAKLGAPFCISMPGAEPAGDQGQAAVSLELGSRLGQHKLERAMLAALDAHSRGELGQAVQLYTQILRLKLADPIRALVYNHRGMAHFARSDYRRAIRDFSRAIDFDAKNTRCYNNRALTFRVLKRFDRSLADYDRSLAIKSSQLDALWGRAQTCYEMKLFTQALADCEKALALQADFAPAQALVRRIGSQVF
ncbi:(p)ppGpp synthetase [Desulfuromonas versatilis]|uniref:(P)ppGpp synthetase n=1 Tax=Desulfuromonas versatilis TaxID=2802975 RepID=A0ABN6DUY8_9BACT|nr:hypothetical protein [Desulfuromonas versatilis]BCR03865.1 (p)ppGpp synthetase [Desulfuromonas versatilis]